MRRETGHLKYGLWREKPFYELPKGAAAAHGLTRILTGLVCVVVGVVMGLSWIGGVL